MTGSLEFRSGYLATLLLVAGSGGAVFVGAASAVQWAFPLVSVAVALWMLNTRQPHSYLVFVLWLWILAPEMRRLVDWSIGRHDLSVVLFTPALVSMVALPWALRGARRLPRRTTRTFYIAGVIFAYAAVIGMLYGRTTAVLADLVQLVPPLALGFFVLSGPLRDEPLRRAVLGFAMYGTLLLGTYGIFQYVFLPPWDAQWMIDSGLNVIGRPQPLSVRVFSTLNAPGPLAQTLAALLLIMSAGPARGLIRTASATVGLLTLGLSQIRSVWMTIAAGSLLLLRSRLFRPGRTLAVMLILVLLVIVAGGPIRDQIQKRVEETVAEGFEDDSLTDRIRFQTSIVPQVLVNPAGRGLGSTGLASDFADDSEAGFASFDSGVLEILMSLGLVAGGTLLVVLTAGVIRGLRVAPNRGPFVAAISSAAAVLLLGLLFTHTLKSANGAVFWLCLGILARPVDLAPSEAQPRPEL